MRAVVRLSSSLADLVWIVGTLCLETGFRHRNGADIHLALFVVTFGKLSDGRTIAALSGNTSQTELDILAEG